MHVPQIVSSVKLNKFAAEGGPTCDPKNSSNYPTDHKWTIYGPYTDHIWTVYGSNTGQNMTENAENMTKNHQN